MSAALTLTEDMESDSGVLGMADSVDSGADVVPGGGEVHVGKSVATSATGHVTSRGRADRLVPGDAGLGDPGGLAPQTDGVPLLGRDLPAPRHGGDTRRHCNDKSLIFYWYKRHKKLFAIAEEPEIARHLKFFRDPSSYILRTNPASKISNPMLLLSLTESVVRQVTDLAKLSALKFERYFYYSKSSV